MFSFHSSLFFFSFYFFIYLLNLYFFLSIFILSFIVLNAIVFGLCYTFFYFTPYIFFFFCLFELICSMWYYSIYAHSRFVRGWYWKIFYTHIVQESKMSSVLSAINIQWIEWSSDWINWTKTKWKANIVFLFIIFFSSQSWRRNESGIEALRTQSKYTLDGCHGRWCLHVAVI